MSLWLFPAHLVQDENLRLVNLGVTPIVAGALMCLIGMWRSHRGQDVLRIDRFSYGYLFALSLGLIRFWFAK
jgi:hypothetical protein